MLLSIHTCGTIGSVALGRVNEDGTAILILAQAALPGRAYAAQLNPRVSEMLAGQHATIQDIEAIVVVRGPGSFTGIRVGLSAAKGLAQPAGIPLIALSHLELIAAVSGLPHVLASRRCGPRRLLRRGISRGPQDRREPPQPRGNDLPPSVGQGQACWFTNKFSKDRGKTGDVFRGHGVAPESALAPIIPCAGSRRCRCAPLCSGSLSLGQLRGCRNPGRQLPAPSGCRGLHRSARAEGIECNLNGSSGKTPRKQSGSPPHGRVRRRFVAGHRPRVGYGAQLGAHRLPTDSALRSSRTFFPICGGRRIWRHAHRLCSHKHLAHRRAGHAREHRDSPRLPAPRRWSRIGRFCNALRGRSRRARSWALRFAHRTLPPSGSICARDSNRRDGGAPTTPLPAKTRSCLKHR